MTERNWYAVELVDPGGFSLKPRLFLRYSPGGGTVYKASAESAELVRGIDAARTLQRCPIQTTGLTRIVKVDLGKCLFGPCSPVYDGEP